MSARRAVAVLATLAVAVGILAIRPPRTGPVAEERPLFDGVHFRRIVRSSPRPLAIHVVAVDLRRVEVVLTPPDGESDFRARTTSAFLDEFDVQVAVNASFFEPFHARSPDDYYPHEGDRVRIPEYWSVGGRSAGTPSDATFWFRPGGEVSIGARPPDAVAALTSRPFLVRDGVAIEDGSTDLMPRTVLGFTADRKTMIFLVADGRQPGWSEGLTLEEVAAEGRDAGMDVAVHFDGGGSSTLAIEGEDGRPMRLNSPIQLGVPGRERPVANHVGVRARRLH